MLEMDEILKNKQYSALNKPLSVDGNINTKQHVSKNKIEQLLSREQEIVGVVKQDWVKLSKTQKLKKLKLYTAVYIDSTLETTCLVKRERLIKGCWSFLRDAFDKKRINNKDVNYDIDDECILDIKSLVYNSDLDRFALKRSKSTTLSNNSIPSFRLKSKKGSTL